MGVVADLCYKTRLCIRNQEFYEIGLTCLYTSGKHFPQIWMKSQFTRVIFYVRRIELYLYKYRIYGTISIYNLKGLAFVYQLM